MFLFRLQIYKKVSKLAIPKNGDAPVYRSVSYTHLFLHSSLFILLLLVKVGLYLYLVFTRMEWVHLRQTILWIFASPYATLSSSSHWVRNCLSFPHQRAVPVVGSVSYTHLCNVWMYTRGFHHTKIIMVDGKFCTSCWVVQESTITAFSS